MSALNAGARRGAAFHESSPRYSPALGPDADGTVPTISAQRPGDRRLRALASALAALAGRYGRNPASATSWPLGQHCVVTALDAFLTPGEQALVASGDGSLVRQLRCAFVAVTGWEYVRAAERALGREVIAHRSEILSKSSICLEIFLLGRERGRPAANPSGVDLSGPRRRRA